MAGNFFQNTRLVNGRLEVKDKPSGGGIVRWQLPKVGILSSLLLLVRGTVSGTLSSPNALGMSSIVRRIQLTTNAGIDLINISGPGYAYLLSEWVERETHLPALNDGRDAVTATTFNLDMYLPVALNLQSELGLVLLQNEQTQVTLTVDFETDTNVATGATVSATVEPVIFYYLVPQSPEDFPALNVLHTLLEETQTISGAGQVNLDMSRGNVYVNVMHGLGMGASGADNWSRFQVLIGLSQYPYDITPDIADNLHKLLTGRDRPAGTFAMPYLSLSGMGKHGMRRDLLNSAVLTNYDHIIQATTSGTLYTLREQLVVLGE